MIVSPNSQPCGSSSRPFPALRFAVGATLALLWLALSPSASTGQVCALEGEPDFAGHTLPLDAPLEPPEFDLVDAFPNLSNFSSSLFLTHAGDGSGRIFVVERDGRIYVFPGSGDVQDSDRTLYLDISTEVLAQAELGLLGLAFDPDFETNGHLYLNYTIRTGSGGSVVCSGPTNTEVFSIVERITAEDPADNSISLAPSRRLELLRYAQPYCNHNGGAMAFGPDGYLYIASGDGGSAGDPIETSENITDLLGAMLRIDPSDGSAPPSNPFADDPNAEPRVYHYGLRNPWRFSFDREPPYEMWIGDVGQNAWEEINRSVGAGIDFGWDLCEATHNFEGSGCNDPVSERPVIELSHSSQPSARSITGGYVYRGSRVPELYGTYLFGDFVFGTVWGWDRVTVDETTGLGEFRELASTPAVASFGEDEVGEVYVVSLFGRIYRFELAASQPGGEFPELLSETGFFTDTTQLTPAPGMLEYDVAAAFWSDRAEKRRWLALPAGARIPFDAVNPPALPVGTAFVKHFELPTPPSDTVRVETRVLLHQEGGWIGLTYRWNDDQTDATLLKTALEEEFIVETEGDPEFQTWRYPSPDGCLFCHTAASGRVLGFRGPQLNKDFNYPGGTQNQLAALNCAQRFVTDIGVPSQFSARAGLEDLTASRAHRARSYLATNCSQCHLPGGPAPGSMDMRAEVLLGQMNLLGVSPTQGNLGLFEPERIKPGAADESVLLERVRTTDPAIRMAPGTFVPHGLAVSLLEDWIDIDLTFPDSDEDGADDANDNCPGVANPDQEDSNLNGAGDACDPLSIADLLPIPTGPNSVFLGQTLTVNAQVMNDGAGGAVSSQVRYYLSEDTVFDVQDDVLVGDCNLPALIGGALAGCPDAGARVPPDLAEIPAGETRPYHWAVCVDAFDLVLEADEANNCAVDPAIVLVPEPRGSLLAGVAVASLFLLAAYDRRRRVSES